MPFQQAGAEEIKMPSQKATFAAGCFWGVEKFFLEAKGVLSTQVGYTGGKTKNPSYEAVCSGLSGHAEAIEIVYDPSQISYEDLVELFFTHHNPTTLNRQGNDVGTQYRSSIFYHNEAQKEAGRKAIEALNKAAIFKSPVITQLEPAAEFYRAEEYHQKYLKKNPNGYCSLQMQPRRVSEVLKEARKVS